MQPSIFNVRVPLPERNEVFLMNTFSDAQLVVSPDVAALLDRVSPDLNEDELAGEAREAFDLLRDNGFLATDHESERRALNQFFRDVREDKSMLKVTVLTTLQCNFACDYCFQGDHGDYNKTAAKMTLETSGRVAKWIEHQLDLIRPESFSLTFFGGEPLLNLPVMYDLAERAWHLCRARGLDQRVSIITNGLLLTPEVVDRMKPFGLFGVKITLDGDRDTHNRMRPLRGGQGTFDRIVENIRRVADRVPIAIGGNFDASSVDSYPALLDFLQAQEFAGSLSKVAFKPIVGATKIPQPKGMLPMIQVGVDGKPLNGTCMTSAGQGGSSACDSCGFMDEKTTFLREETKRHGFPTLDGVHMGPCEIHREHAHTIGPDGTLHACPGFTGDPTQSVGHIDADLATHGRESRHEAAAERFEHLAAWKECGDCSFIPVCAGGCSVASHTELGDMNTPTCHKLSFVSAVASLAHEAALAA